jgi:MFS family permease
MAVSAPVEAKQAAVPGARLALALLLTINLFNYLDRYVLSSTLSDIQTSLFPEGGPAVKTLEGSLGMAFMVSYMVLAPAFGFMAERWSRWWLVGIGVVLWSLASGASGLAGGFAALLITRCFVGVGEAAYGPVAPTMIADLYPIRVRGKVLAWFYAAIPVGSALGYAWGAVFRKWMAGVPAFSVDLLAWHVGVVSPDDVLVGWRWAFYLVLPAGLILGAWCFCMREPPRGQAELGGGVRVGRPSWKDYQVLLRTPSYVLNTLGMAAMTFAIGGIAFWMPHYLEEYRQRPDPGVLFGAIVAVTGLAATLTGGYVGDRLRDRFPGSYFLVSGVAMLVAFPFFLAALWAPFPLAWVCIFVTCFFLFFNTGPTNTILANVTHPAIRATGFALNIFVIHLLGDAISPPVIGAIADATAVDGKANMNAGFLAVSGMILLGGVFWLWGTRYLKADTDRAPHSLPERAAPASGGR